MPSPASPSRRSGSKDSHRASPKPAHRHSPHRTRSQDRDHPHPSSPRPAATRRHTVQPQLHSVDRPLPPLPGESSPKPRPSARRTKTLPLPTKDGHVLIPVPIRAKDAESPVYIKALPGQRVQFVFSPPEKKSFIGRLLDKVEWEDETSQAGSPFRYRKPRKKSSSGTKPFYQRLLPWS